MANPRGQIVKRDYSFGRSVNEVWACLFAWNERAWRRTPHLVQTDAELRELALKAFPDRAWSRGFQNVKRKRGVYNRGVLTKGRRPREPSYEYLWEDKRVYRVLPGRYWNQMPYRRPKARRREVQISEMLLRPALSGLPIIRDNRGKAPESECSSNGNQHQVIEGRSEE